MIRRLALAAVAIALTISAAPSAFAQVVAPPAVVQVDIPPEAAPAADVAGPIAASVCAQVFGAVGTASIAGLATGSLPSLPVGFNDASTYLFYAITQACYPVFPYLAQGTECAAVEGAVKDQVKGAGSPVGVPVPAAGGIAVDAIAKTEATATGTSGQSLPASPSSTIGSQLDCKRPSSAPRTSSVSASGTGVGTRDVTSPSVVSSRGTSSYGSGTRAYAGAAGASTGSYASSGTSTVGGAAGGDTVGGGNGSTVGTGSQLAAAQPTSSKGSKDKRGKFVLVMVVGAALLWAADAAFSEWKYSTR